jgi:putative oxidoreductase
MARSRWGEEAFLIDDGRRDMNMNRAAQIAYLLLRLVAGLMMFQPGAMSLLGWFGGIPGMPPGSTTPLMSQMGIGGMLEIVGGILIMAGLLTRPVAFILSGEMAVAYWQFHFPKGTWPVQNDGVPAVLLCFIFLFMAAQGGGDHSLDALIRRRRAKER